MHAHINTYVYTYTYRAKTYTGAVYALCRHLYVCKSIRWIIHAKICSFISCPRFFIGPLQCTCNIRGKRERQKYVEKERASRESDDRLTSDAPTTKKMNKSNIMVSFLALMPMYGLRSIAIYQAAAWPLPHDAPPFYQRPSVSGVSIFRKKNHGASNFGCKEIANYKVMIAYW